MFEQKELVRLWGTEGRVADLAAKLGCTNCKAKGKRRPRVYVEVVKITRSRSEAERERMKAIDVLTHEILKLKPSGMIE